jgi:hypothetical protein
VLALEDGTSSNWPGHRRIPGSVAANSGGEAGKVYDANNNSKAAAGRLEEILRAIRDDKTDWSQVVFTASNNYVLQTLYVKFRNFKLHGLLPDGLVAHLEHVYRLNLERNKKMLKQAGEINRLLKAGGITGLFLKGIGNLADGLYADPGERIMSDIDILTGPDQMEAAAYMLIANGYKTYNEYRPERSATMKHFPVLYKEGEPARVDIHRQPVNIQYSDLFDFEQAGSHQRPANGDPSFMVLSDKHKIWLGFIHSQLIHWGHYYAMPSLRDLYDMQLLSAREDVAGVLSEYPSIRGKAAGFLQVMDKTFGEGKQLPSGFGSKGKLSLLRHRIMLGSRPSGMVIFKILKAWRLYIDIPVKSLFRKNYRLYVRVRLEDAGWYRRNLGIDRVFGKKK